MPLLSQTLVKKKPRQHNVIQNLHKVYEQKKTSGIKFVKPSACNKSCKVIIEKLLSLLLLWGKLQTTPLGFINNNWKTRITDWDKEKCRPTRLFSFNFFNWNLFYFF